MQVLSRDRPFRARATLGMLVAALVSSLAVPVAAAQESEPADDEVTLPQTLEKVWYRAGTKKDLAGLRPFKAAGDLTLTREGLEFHGGKESFSIPLANISMVSLGTLGGDVDTLWAVLTVREGGLDRIVAFKDGKALGYGRSTPQIYLSIRSAMQRLGGAQYRVPPGYVAYAAFDDQLALMYPEGWSVQIPAAISVGDRTPWGTMLFTSRPLEGGPELLDAAAIRHRVDDAGTDEFFLVREEAAGGFKCRVFKPQAVAVMRDRAAADPLFQGPYTLVESPRSTPVTIGGCEGLRVLARGRDAAGSEVVLDLRAVTRRDTLFTFGVRARASEHDRLLQAFEPVVAAVRFAPAVDH